MNWQEISGNWALIPQHPKGIIHFLGGAFLGTVPHVTYRLLLEHLGKQGYIAIATPFVNTYDHTAIARSVLRDFESTLEQLRDKALIKRRYLPTYGLGHSMGCKLHLLIGSLYPVERAGNMLLCFNNFAARDAVPLAEQFSPIWGEEFTPSPLETIDLIAKRYQIRRNLLVRFTNDTIDQSLALAEMLQKNFPGMVAAKTLPGNHLTPLGQDVKWEANSVFTPLDAIAQWMRQEVYRDLDRLKQEITLWLNPF
ncbi:MAG: DUF1350 family protein [Cyanosarcina radialis HA8281-LM2]|nr:DUF1350 family protein [Cyanosarcina radialis HA8281-LM2]